MQDVEVGKRKNAKTIKRNMKRVWDILIECV